MRVAVAAVAIVVLAATCQAIPLSQDPSPSSPSHITAFDFPKGTEQGTDGLPRVQLLDTPPAHLAAAAAAGEDLLELGEGLQLAPNPSSPITEHQRGELPLAVQAAQSEQKDAQKAYNDDPWSVYGGERSLFCRIQYYHDTVEFSPQCELEAFNAINPEYHTARYNCQFFEQRGVLYFYGEKWIDCTPLSQRGQKVVMECGVQCAPRKSLSEVSA